jgi:DNA-binding transcriptional ArsR family regulator
MYSDGAGSRCVNTTTMASVLRKCRSGLAAFSWSEGGSMLGAVDEPQMSLRAVCAHADHLMLMRGWARMGQFAGIADRVYRPPRADHSTRWLTFISTAHTFNHMVEHMHLHMNPRLDAVFHALGDATRRQMLHSLAQGECTVSQLAEPFDMSLAAASKHIKALEGAGLIQREVRGRTHVCRLDASPLSDAHQWLRFYERFWHSRLDELERLLREDARKDAPKGTSQVTPKPPPRKQKGRS